MTISLLSNTESQNIINIVEGILRSDVSTQIFKNKQFIMVSDRRKEIYLISKEDQYLIEVLNKISKGVKCTPKHIKLKLGFLIKEKFKIGIESLPFLAPYTKAPFILTPKQVNRFIYGKNILLDGKDEINNQGKLEEGQIVIVFEKSMIPLGYGKIVKKPRARYLENLVDIGIYLRSEKSAF
jgi:ribosome biogenesis protein Nip4